MRPLFTDLSLPYLLRDEAYPVGGWTVQLRSWLEGLSQRGIRAGVLTRRGGRAIAGHTPLCELIDTYDPERGVKIAKYFYYFIPALLEGARSYHPDVVIQATRGIDTAIMSYVADRLGVPFVHRIASDADVDERYVTGLQPYERAAYAYGLRRAAAVLCQNEYQLTAVRKLFPNKPARIIHNPFQPPARIAVPPRDVRRTIAWLGIFRYPKNLPLLLKVAQSLPDLSFEVAGKPARNIDRESQDALEVLRTLPNVAFAGYLNREQVPAYLGQAIMLLCTSRYEGFSNTFLESFSLGTPVVTQQTADPDGIVGKNRLGAVATSDDDLIAQVRAIGALPASEFAQLANRCQDYVFTQHNPRRKVDELAAALGDVGVR